MADYIFSYEYQRMYSIYACVSFNFCILVNDMMTEDEVKEIAAKVFHEKMRDILPKMKNELESEIKDYFFAHKTKLDDFFVLGDLQKLKAAMERECVVFISRVLKKYLHELYTDFKF